MSTGRFMAVWAVGQAAALGLAAAACQSFHFVLYSPSGHLTLLWVEAGLGGVLLGSMGAWLLRTRRRRITGWWWATALGVLFGTILARESAQAVLRAANVGGWAGSTGFRHGLILLWTLTGTLVLGAAQGGALWKLRWPQASLLWLAGLLAVEVVATASRWAFEDLTHVAEWPGYGFNPAWGLKVGAQAFAVGLIQGAGTAWLLDRCVFKREAEPAPSA